MSTSALRVGFEQLRRTYDPATLAMQTTDDLEPLEGVTGQDRALAALRFGLGMRAEGFNVYASGPHGIGRMTAVVSFLGELAGTRDVPPDLCYVHNFEEPYKPLCLVLSPGQGCRLRQKMRTLIDDAVEDIPKVFGSEEYGEARGELNKALDEKRSELLSELSEAAHEADHSIKLTPMGMIIVPQLGERDLTEAELGSLPESARKEIDKRGDMLREKVRATLKKIRAAELATKKARSDLDREVTLFAVGHLVDDLREDYADQQDVLDYLDQVQENLLDRAFLFLEASAEERAEIRRHGIREFQVNVLVDNGPRAAQVEASATQDSAGSGEEAAAPDEAESPKSTCPAPREAIGAPVIVELNPSYSTLFGKIEKEGEIGGVVTTDFTMIRAGSMHRANGGFLVIPVEDLLRSLLSWDALKRALRSGALEIEEPGERLGLISTKSLHPDPIPLAVKVVLVGSPLIYYLLHRFDSDFHELFKVKADFDTLMSADESDVMEFLRFLRRLCCKEELLPIDAPAAARLLEHSSRLAGDREKLSTLFGELSDVIREAHFWAQEEGVAVVGLAQVEKALEQQIYRSNLLEERIQEVIAEGTLRISVDGETVGQVNGLSVIQVGAYAFGRPSRITASVAVGREGVVDIERKVELGGPVHSKGVMILSGYLLSTYGRERPLSLSARLAFEQSYSEVEGDSASATELYALLSAVSEVPIRQGVAVTGSVDQRGHVQAVGGINEKIEGYFKVCRAIGLTGRQGVVIPRGNLRHLMLRQEVVDAVEQGQFSVWAVDHIEEGLQILTGLEAGVRGRDERFTHGSIHALVSARLERFSKSLQKLGSPPEDEEAEAELIVPPRLAAGGVAEE